MRFFGFAVLLLGLWSNPLLAEQAANSQGQEQKSPQQKAMDMLAAAGIGEAIKAIKSYGSFYPFGLVQVAGSAQAMSYSGKKEDAPPAEQWAQILFNQLREEGKKRPEVDMLALFKLHSVSDENGNKEYGIWVEVDHRRLRPAVIFLPLVKKDNGKHELGEPVYLPTDQPLFDHAE